MSAGIGHQTFNLERHLLQQLGPTTNHLNHDNIFAVLSVKSVAQDRLICLETLEESFLNTGIKVKQWYKSTVRTV